MKGVKKYEHMVIPLDLCQFVLKERLISPFKLYVYLQFKTSGTIELKSGRMEIIKSDLNIQSRKTINSYLKKLKDLNWVGQKPYSRIYYIRNIDFLHNQIGLIKKIGVLIYFGDLKYFRAFLFGAFISGLIKSIQRKPKPERVKGRSHQGFNSLNGFLSYSINNYGKDTKCILIDRSQL